MNSISRQLIPQEIRAASGFIPFANRISENNTFAAEFGNAHHNAAEAAWSQFGSVNIVNSAKRNGAGASATLDCSGRLALAQIPSGNHVGQVKRSESNIRLVPMMTAQPHGIRGDLKAVTTRPNAAINPHVGQSFGEPVGRVNDCAGARPENLSIPHNAAVADFFLIKPTANPLRSQIASKRHIGFRNHFCLKYGKNGGGCQ